jgi:hypothetical protein
VSIALKMWVAYIYTHIEVKNNYFLHSSSAAINAKNKSERGRCPTKQRKI